MTLHALQRAKERYELDLTFDDLREILNKILEGQAKLRHCACNSICIYKLRYKHKLICPVVADGERIVTFYPAEGSKPKSFDKDAHYRKLRLKGAVK